MSELVLVLDCGSTNITAAAVDGRGEIVSAVSEPNGPVSQPGGREDWLVWDVEKLWETVCRCSRRILDSVEAHRIRAVTATTWGADGAPVDECGRPTYPPIAWECPRTRPVAREVAGRFGERRLFGITGYKVISFNTLFDLAWLRENEPRALDGAHRWLMMPGLLSHRLCGEMSLDATTASTMMMLDLAEREWSPELLEIAGVDASLFPPLLYPGDVIGRVTAEAAERTALPEGIPVVASGHDTQFAPVGSGAGRDEAILSTGTWEICMLRTGEPATNDVAFEEGVLNEFDAVEGLYNPQLLMMGSGVLEWVRERFYDAELDRSEAYAQMIEEASSVPPGADGVTVAPSFVPDTGPLAKHETEGTILGLGLKTKRAHIYRAALEGLCFQLRHALEILKRATGFEPRRLRVVGGGSRNALWNRLRADVCRLPVVVTETKEATVVGAAVAAWTGCGRFDSLSEGEEALATRTRTLEPGGDAETYGELYERYRTIGPALSDFYAD